MTKPEKIGNICFWIGIFIEILAVIIDKSDYINPYESIIFRTAFVLFCIKILTTKYTAKQWVCMAAVGLIAVISYFVNEKDEVVRAVVLVAACKDIDIKKLISFIFYVTAAGCAVIFLLSVTGIYGKMTVTANFGRGPSPGIVETRYCFGMGHPNAFQCMILMITSLILYVDFERLDLIHFILLLFFNFLSFKYTDSNTSMIVAFLMISGVAFMKYCKAVRDNKILYILPALLLVALVILSAYGSHVGRGQDGDFIFRLDYLLNGRFQYANIVENAQIENWKLFGMASNQEFFDQAYIRLFYWYGIVPAVLYILGNLYLIYQSYRHKDYPLLVIVTAYAVFSIMEAHLVSVYLLRNYLLILLGVYWYREPYLEEKEECYLWNIPKNLIYERNV